MTSWTGFNFTLSTGPTLPITAFNQALDKRCNLYHHETPMAVLDHRLRIKALVIAGVLAALLSLIVDSSVGPRPLVWLNFKYGTVVIHVPWLIALFFTSAVATFLAKRNGARLSQCLLVGISPALIIGTLFSLLMAVIVVMAACPWRIVISPNLAHDSSGFPVFLRFCYGNLVVLFILWFAKATAEAQQGAVLRRVVLLRLSRG
jgi:ascorbate-specific PTS system EIIC-type component UlaA